MSAAPDVIRVLSIEDNPADARLIRELLAAATRLAWDMPHFEITHVQRMSAALEHLDSAPVDAILTDLDLPDSRSDTTFSTLRNHAPTLPIVVLTSRDDVTLARNTVRAGAEDYLYKREMSGTLLAHALLYAIERREDKLALQKANETLEARVQARTEELEQANRALRESEQRYRITFEEAPVGVTQTDLDGHWIHVNQRFCEIVGYTPQELIQLRWQDLTHPDDLEADEGGTRRMLEGKISTFSYEKRYIRRDGATIWVDLTASLVRDTTGQPEYIIAIVQDITARKTAETALQQSEAQYRTLTNAAPVGISQTALDGHWIHVNQRFCEIIKYTREEMTDMRWQDLTHPDDLDLGKRRTQRLLAGEIPSFSLEKRYIRKDDAVIWVGLTISLVRTPTGEPDYFISIIQDITGRKEAEAVLQKSRARYQALFDASPLPYLIEDASALKAYLTALRDSGVTDFPTYFSEHPQETHHCAALMKIVDANQAALDFYGAAEKEELLGSLDRVFCPEACQSSVNNLIAIAEGKKERRFETVNQTLRGEKKQIVLEWAVAPGYEESFSRILVFVVDITARKEIEAALRREQNRLQVLMANFPDTIYFKDANSRFTRINTAQAETLGIDDPAEALGKTDAAFFGPSFAKASREDEEQILQTGKPLVNKMEQIPLADGTSRWVLATKVPIKDAEGHVTGLVGVSRDITQRRAAEAALRQSRAELVFQAELLDQIQDNIIATDLEGRITYVNAAATHTLQRSQEELIGETVHILGENPDDGTNQENIIESTRHHGVWEGTVVNYARNGTPRFMQSRTWLIRDSQTDEPTGMIGVSTDITQRREAEEAFERIFNMASELISVADIENATFTLVNPAFEKILGYTEEELLTRPFLEFIHPDDIAPTIAVVEEELQAGVEVISFQNRYRCKDNSYRWLSWNSHPIPERKLTYAIATDITERKQKEKALQESEARYRGLFENAPISLWEEDFSAVKAHLDELQERGVEDFEQYFTDHPEAISECMTLIRFTDFNEATLEHYNAKSKQELKQRLDIMLGSKTHPALRRILLAIARGEKRTQAETVNYTLDGEKINVHIDWRVAPGYEETLEKCFISLKDITDLKKTQAALQSANKELVQYAKALKRSNRDLEYFAYVTSHDLQQPLRTVTGFLQLLERYYSDALDDKARLYIDSAVTGADRMTKMIRALLDLSRVGTRGAAFKATDMDAVLEETIQALQHNIEENKARITHDALPTVMGDATQLGQLLQNLIANAIKFQRDGTQPHIHISATQEGETWRFAVQDNGIGIDPEHGERLFRVFQRLHTREEYPGVGIGLALCKRIVERHSGEIWVESEPGEGSTFYFTVERRA